MKRFRTKRRPTIGNRLASQFLIKVDGDDDFKFIPTAHEIHASGGLQIAAMRPLLLDRGGRGDIGDGGDRESRGDRGGRGDRAARGDGGDRGNCGGEERQA